MQKLSATNINQGAEHDGHAPSIATVSPSSVLMYMLLQNVPLATEPGISLIILTPMKILQRNLNRSAFFSFTFLTQ